jgi:nucleoside-diphosphate-sugar epimerase
MRVLIVGCGRLGSSVAERLVADAHTVFGLRRSDRALPDGVVPLIGDVSRPESLQLPEALDACIYAVAAGGRSDDAYRAAYPGGVANVVQALGPQAAATRLLFVSSTGVYGEDGGGVVDEASPTEPKGFTGRRLLEAEEIVAASGFSSCSLRLSGIYGPNRRMLLDRVRSGEASYPIVGERWMNQIHQHDAARALVHVLGLDALPEAFCISDTRPSRRREVLEWLAQEMGAPAPSASAENSSRRGEGAGKRVDSTRLQASGFCFSFPTYVQGYGSFIG